ncbi:UNVERIFIED_CONTAM: hypothetical protein H355_006519, partial [Colinus virginianus]
MTPKEPILVMETPSPDPKGPRSGGHQDLEVGSDTDVEGEELNPDVTHPENPLRDQRSPHRTPKDLTVVMETPSPDPKGPQSGARNLDVDSDTDIEGEELNPSVPHPKNHLRDQRAPHRTPKEPAVGMETPNADPKGSQSGGHHILEVDSDTDVEEELNPDVPHSRNKRTPHMTPKGPTVGMETPNPNPKGPQSGGHHILEVDSDTDVEEELNPDVPHPENRLRNHRTPHMTPKEPILVMETPSPDPKGPRSGGHQDLEVGSDTDVEGEELNPDVTHPENPLRDQRSPHRTPKDLTVVMETPSPDPKGPQSGARNLDVDSDTDIEGEELNPSVPHPKNHLRDQR